MYVMHVHREGLREIRDTLDMRDCDSSCFVDKIMIAEDGNHTFVVTLEDFKKLYSMKLKERGYA